MATLLRRSTSWRFASSCSGVNRFLLVAHGWLVGTAVGIWSPSPTVIRRRARAASIASSLNSGAGEVRMPDMTPVGSWQIQTCRYSLQISAYRATARALTFVEAVAVHVSIIREADTAVDKAVHRAEPKRGGQKQLEETDELSKDRATASMEAAHTARAYDVTHPRARPRREIRRAANRASTPAPRACVVRTAGSGAGSGRTAGRLVSRFAGAALCGAVVAAAGLLLEGAPRACFAGVPAAGGVDAFATTARGTLRARLLPPRLSVAAEAVRRLPQAGSWTLFMVSFHAPWSSAAPQL